MSACEKCWGDAYLMSLKTGNAQHECYNDLLHMRRNNPCTPEQQAGQFWDEENQIDRRLLPEKEA